MADDHLQITEEDITRISRLVGSLTQRLRTQREQLRKHGMDVPPGTLQGMDTIHEDMDEVGAKVIEQGYELDRLRALAETTSIVNSSLDLDEVLMLVMDTVLKLTGAERGYILLRNMESGSMEFRIARGLAKQDVDGESPVVSKTVVDEVLSSGEAIVTTNAQLDDRFAGQKSIVGYSLRSILCVPLIIKGDIEGVVYADNSIKDGLFGNKELQLVNAIASQSALAIENARLFAQARATLDQITEIKTLLDNILASIASGVITTDADNIITTYNVGAENILGFPFDTTYGKSLEEALLPIYSSVREVLPGIRTQDEVITLETESEVPTGLRNLNLRLSPLKDAADTTQGVALVVDDMTDVKKRDAMLDAVRRYLPPVMVDNIKSIENIGLGGDRRLITVIFVEVRPFHTFSASLQAGEVMELLNTYLTVGTETIHRKAGLIDKYMGSEIMGLFNTQLNPSDEHALDAVEAAIEMMRDFHILYEQLGQHPELPYYRMGIHTGEATLGNVGGKNRREFTAIGDTVNLAKRLQENAHPGQFLISEDTFNACAGQLQAQQGISVIPLGYLAVKGRKQKVLVYEIQPDMVLS
ncbi:MAG TPA: adenylate/guanylate cyclase domain-containing protein [Aggregatilineales bacterium]|nr:adenylate/guanylate cyclase domain-containing protein [Aggregatilineales bacterium]